MTLVDLEKAFDRDPLKVIWWEMRVCSLRMDCGPNLSSPRLCFVIVNPLDLYVDHEDSLTS